MGAKWFGAAVKRKEDPAFLTGKAQYIDDIDLPGTLHAAFVRSPHAHARVLSIDSEEAKRAPGVQAVLDFNDLPEDIRQTPLPLWVPNPAITQAFLQYALAQDEVCLVGEPVAIVIADTRHRAEDAASLVNVEYVVLPAASDCREALKPGAPLAHSGATSNVAAEVLVNVGDTDAAFANAAHVFKRRIHQHRGGAFFIECRGLVVTYERFQGLLTVYIASQGPHRIKRAMMDLLHLPDHRVRAIAPDIGGGFGPKQSFYPEYLAVAVAAMKLARPIKWIEDRRENFIATNQERDQYWDMEIAVDKDARLLGLRGEMVHDCGAYIPWGIILPWIAATTVPGPYVLPNYRLKYYAVMTNKIPCTPVRGAGRPQAVVTMERMMDLVAQEMKIDRTEVRRLNFIQPNQMPYPVGIVFRDGREVVYDSGDYPKTQQDAIEASDYKRFKSRQEAARKEGRYVGIGISNSVEGTGLGPYEGATVRISTDGGIDIFTGATPQGQSHKTTLAQIAADHLGVDMYDVNIVTGDTATIALGIGSSAARTAVNAGNSVHLAAIEVSKKIKKLAAQMMDVSPDDIELSGGFARVRGSNQQRSFRELAIRSIGVPGFAMNEEPGIEHTSYFLPPRSTYANATHVAEVEVDIETGQVNIQRFTVAHDCGRAINPLVVEGQVIGGIAHGIGNALFERLVYDENAQPLTTNFGEYAMPVAPDVPNFDIKHNETPSPLNPLGVKGAGEGGTIASIAAILGAIEDALRPFGVSIDEAPIHPQRLVKMLGAAALGRTK
jgi:carbon-monoxide dehydrogenase large subunit